MKNSAKCQICTKEYKCSCTKTISSRGNGIYKPFINNRAIYKISVEIAYYSNKATMRKTYRL
jgi:hypothetical protein